MTVLGEVLRISTQQKLVEDCNFVALLIPDLKTAAALTGTAKLAVRTSRPYHSEIRKIPGAVAGHGSNARERPGIPAGIPWQDMVSSPGFRHLDGPLS